MNQKIKYNGYTKINLMAILSLAIVTLALLPASLALVNLQSYSPSPATAGQIVEVKLLIQGGGNIQSQNTFIEFHPEFPFSLVQGESAVKNIGKLTAYPQPITFRVYVDKSASQGKYNIKFYDYLEGYDSKGEDSFPIDVKNRDSAEIIYIDQVQLLPGKITPLKFTINNVGNAPLRNLVFTWSNDNGIILPVSSDDTKYIKELNIGQSAQLTYDVIASVTADPNLYKLNLRLQYDDPTTGNKTQINTNAGVYVGGETDFDLAFSGISKSGTSFSIANIGSVSANSVTVRIPKQPGWNVKGVDSVIIGNLNKGDYTIASFNLQNPTISNSASSKYTGKKASSSSPPSTHSPTEVQLSSLNLEISYTDTRGERKIVTKTLELDHSTLILPEDPTMIASSKNSSWTTYLIYAVVILVLYFMYRWYTKKKEKDPLFRLTQLLPKKKK